VKNGRYFFYGGKGTLRTNVNSWRNRVSRLFSIAARLMAEEGGKFAFKPIQALRFPDALGLG
jgi:hypothetical protein